jgi:hypothetical protein
MRNKEANQSRQHWQPQRAALHRAIVESYLNGHQPVINPELFAVLSGPASGKAFALNDAKSRVADGLPVPQHRQRSPDAPGVWGCNGDKPSGPSSRGSRLYPGFSIRRRDPFKHQHYSGRARRPRRRQDS